MNCWSFITFLAVPKRPSTRTILRMRKAIFCILLITSFLSDSFASHIRGGYITAKRIEGYKYEFLLTVYRDKNSPILDAVNELHPDLNSSDVIQASVIQPIAEIPGKETQICQYKFIYTYKSPGVYTAYHYQFFRNQGILNMDLSSGTTFYVETKVIIDPFLAFDQSPIITKPAVDFANVGSIYRYNPGAYDPDGDSLSYELVPSRQFLVGQERSAVVTNYRDPAVRAGGLDSAGTAPARLTLDPVTGELVWNVPRLVGEFNTAIKIVQWRKIRANRIRRDSIGYALLDLQIIVRDTRNKKPILQVPQDTCVVAGTFLRGRIFANDPDPDDRVNISFFGELDTLQPPSEQANFSYTNRTVRPFYGDFTWQTRCSHVRSQPYYAGFTAEDIPASGGVPLVDVKIWRIKVVGPAPVLKSLRPDGNGKLRLTWNRYICSNADKIWIYRKIDSSQIALDTCRPGMPSNAGFVKIAEVSGSDTTYLDDNNGQGLRKGPSYCYRIVARFPDPKGGESLVSDEMCRPLDLNIPVLVNVDVQKTATTDGEILVRWTTPFFIDTAAFRPPYTIQLWRSEPNIPAILVRTTSDTTDTTYVDTGLNTREKQYSYQLFFRFGNERNLVDSTEKATFVRLEPSPGVRRITLDWTATTPWSNQGRTHYIYRKTNLEANFALIDSILTETASWRYVDTGRYQNTRLSDTTEYCYYVVTQGSYANPSIAAPLWNRSQISCATPTDTVRPCQPPDLIVQDPIDFPCNDCEKQATQTEFSRLIKWRSVARDTCGSDVSRYRVYFSPYEEDALQLLVTTTDTFFLHSSLSSLAGCYSVAAVDRSGNESSLINKTCVDNCVVFDLPNTVLSEGSDINQVFRPSCFSRAFIRNIHFTLYNRWGKLVYEDDVPPEINWSGQAEGNKTEVNSGVYYYLLDVNAIRLRRKDEAMKFKGWIYYHKP